MAGKSNKGKNRRGSHNTTNAVEPANSSVPLKDNVSSAESSKANANGNMPLSESASTETEAKPLENANSENQAKQGEIHLYPVSVKTQGGKKLELQLSPGNSVMDVRQFLLDAPETCFFTCYDLLLHTKDGSVHQLEDYNEISEVADITTGDCFLEMVAALYDDRSIRAHVHRTRELLSLSTLHSSLSTSLALQHETGKSTPANSGDSAKTEVPELDSLGFMEDETGSLTNLLSSPSEEIKCVESIVFSSLNPPPSYRRLVGDLIYLDVITLEGNKLCITGTTKMFYVNSSTGNVLDPRPSKAASESATLIGLLQKISPKFKKAFREILERKASAHPFENVQSLLPPNSWLGLYPFPDAPSTSRAGTSRGGGGLVPSIPPTHHHAGWPDMPTELTGWRYGVSYPIPIEPPMPGHRYVIDPDSPPPPREYIEGVIGLVASLEGMVLRREAQLSVMGFQMPPVYAQPQAGPLGPSRGAGPSRPFRGAGRGPSRRRRVHIIEEEPDEDEEEEAADRQSETSADREDGSGLGSGSGGEAEGDPKGDDSDSDDDDGDGGGESIPQKRTRRASYSCS